MVPYVKHSLAVRHRHDAKLRHRHDAKLSIWLTGDSDLCQSDRQSSLLLGTDIVDMSTSNSVTGWLSPARRVHRWWAVGRPPDVDSQLRNKPARWINKQSRTKLAVLLPAGDSAMPKKCLRCPLTGSSLAAWSVVYLHKNHGLIRDGSPVNTGRYKP